MVDALVGVLIDNINSLIRSELGLVWDVEADIRKLSSLLSTIRAVLEDAEMKQFSEKPIEDWLLKLKDAAYDAGDVLDEWVTNAQRTHCTNGVSISALSLLSLNQIKFRSKIAKHIKKMITKFDEIAQERLKFHLSPGVVQTGFQLDDNRETSSFLTEKVVYGRDGDKEKIIDILLSNVNRDEDVSILPILGIAGLGKTTLAQLVYHDVTVVEHFNARIWVCVSDNFETKRLTKMILEALTRQACDMNDLDPMQHQLQEKLNGKKFLMVLDDVWNEDLEKWHRLKCSLTCGAKGSSIVITTRLETVASIMGTISPHPLTFLSEEQCWSLFKRHAFGVGSEETSELVEIGKEIIKKCGGVPLAAKALGGLMFTRGEVHEWLQVRDSEIWELPHVEVNGILPSLRLSYNHLPAHFKQCFAFCSIYPKNYSIDKEELIHLWMANGFVQSDAGMQLEDSANLVFNELLRRSFFQDIQKDKFGNIRTCKMHDLMHDLASLVSAEECGIVKVDKAAGSLSKGIRHCSLVFDSRAKRFLGSHNFQSLFQSNPMLRTQILLGNYKHNIKSPQINLKDLDRLRALDLSKTKINVVPFSIGRMKHLRYLNFCGTVIRLLPESICNLRNLQSLKLRDCHNLQKLPKQMSKMTNLQHLDIRGCHQISEMPNRMGQLILLQTFSIFVVGRENGRRIKELQGLNHLRGEVEIKGLENVTSSEEARKANLIRRRYISSLGLSWTDGVTLSPVLQEKVIEGLEPHPNVKVLSIKMYGGVILPSWMPLMPNLVEISLYGCSSCECLPPLGHLPLLKVLSVSIMGSVKCIGDVFYGEVGSALQGFPSLEELTIESMNNLEDWLSPSSEENPRQVFPCLKKLSISRCPELKAFPFLPYLQFLTLNDCNEMMVRSLEILPPCLHTLEISDFKELTSLPVAIFLNSAALKSLTILSCEKLRSLPAAIENLKELKSLSIQKCRELVSLSDGLQKLTSLEKLEIWSCDSIKCLPVMRNQEYEGLRYLMSLQSLSIRSCQELELSTDVFQHLISLRYLSIRRLPKLITLPEGMQHLTMLQSLFIARCKNLRQMPACLQHLSNLQILGIFDCRPALHKRCEKDKGKDWHKISHISDLRIHRKHHFRRMRH